MKNLFIIPMLFIAVSCGKSEEEKREEKVNKGEAKIEQMNEVFEILANDYGVTFGELNGISAYQVNQYSSRVANNYSHKKCNEVKAYLSQYVTLGNEVLEIANSDGITYAHKYELNEMKRYASTLNSSITCISLEKEQDIQKSEEKFELAESNLEKIAGFKFTKADESSRAPILTYNTTLHSTYDEISKAKDTLIQYLEAVNKIKISNLDAKYFADVKVEEANKALELFESFLENKTYHKLVTKITNASNSIDTLSIQEVKQALADTVEALRLLEKNSSIVDSANLEDTKRFLSDYKTQFEIKINVSQSVSISTESTELPTTMTTTDRDGEQEAPKEDENN